MKEVFKPMTTLASETMLQAMKDLKDKKIDPKEAQAIAQLGMSIVQAANSEIQFIKATKTILKTGSFGNDIQFLEPPTR